MGFDRVCNKGLVLELGLSSSMMENNSINTTKKLCNNKTFDPSLNLSLSSDHGGLYRQDSVSGGGSSFSVASHVSVKRKRDVRGEDSERAMISASIDHEIEEEEEEEEVDDVNGRKKLRLTKAQSALLEEAFIHQSTLNPKQKQELARELKLRPRQVEVWFQNRRARTKLKQTEVECEYLKKCCEALKEENTKLHKELQRLKAQPFYMQVPAATLTMCPSCERIGGTTSTTVSSKPHFPHPFTNNPSAAC